MHLLFFQKWSVALPELAWISRQRKTNLQQRIQVCPGSHGRHNCRWPCIWNFEVWPPRAWSRSWPLDTDFKLFNQRLKFIATRSFAVILWSPWQQLVVQRSLFSIFQYFILSDIYHCVTNKMLNFDDQVISLLGRFKLRYLKLDSQNCGW